MESITLWDITNENGHFKMTASMDEGELELSDHDFGKASLNF